MGDGATNAAPRRRRRLTDPLGLLIDTVVPNVVDAIDVDDVVAQVDVDALAARVDLDALLARVDVNALLDRVDPNALLDRVDPNALLDRVDVNALARRLDIDAVVASVDLDAALARVDLDRVIERVDIDHIVQRADVAGIVARSTRGMTAQTLDLARRQVVGVDEIVTRVAARLLGRDPRTYPTAPPALRAITPAAPTRHSETSISGCYAGPLGRMAALVVDVSAMVFLFGIGTALASWTGELLFGIDGELGPPWATILFVAWALLYSIVPLAMTGRTPGKALVGLRVVRRDGQPLHLRQAVVRAVVLPFSFTLLGLGLLGALIGRERRTLHDLAAGSTVVIDWGDRAAELPTPIADWLARRQAGSTDPAPAT